MKKEFTQVWVTFRKECYHRFPAAAVEPRFADVAYLGSRHRHILHFKVGIEVFHDDRDIEFIQFLHWLEGLYAGGVLEVDAELERAVAPGAGALDSRLVRAGLIGTGVGFHLLLDGHGLEATADEEHEAEPDRLGSRHTGQISK